MTREFVILPEFDKRWKEIGFTDTELRILQEELTINPTKGDLMQETGGLRKIRVAFEGRGKSGSVRILYVDFEAHERILLLNLFAKDEKENLTREERNRIKKAMKQLETDLFGGKK